MAILGNISKYTGFTLTHLGMSYCQLLCFGIVSGGVDFLQDSVFEGTAFDDVDDLLITS